MRDPRLDELAFLARLEAGNYEYQWHDGHTFPYLTAKQFRDLILQLLLDGCLNGPASLPVNDSSFGKLASLVLDKKTATCVRQILGRAQTPLEINHRGRVRLWTLKAELESKRPLDDLGILHKRQAFSEDYQILWSFEPPKPPKCAMVIACDLDNFKSVNDTCGHPVGDAALKLYMSTIRATLGKTGEAYRTGGDELLILARDVSDPKTVVESLRSSVETAFKAADWVGIDRIPKRPTVTMGAVVLHKAFPEEAAVNLADDELLAAKIAGKNRARIHEATA